MRSYALPYWMSLPCALFIVACAAIPLVMLLALSFYPFQLDGSTGLDMTLENYAQIITDSYYGTIFARTFGMAAFVTAICILIGIPEAYILTRLSPRWRAISIAIVLGPLLVSVIVRTLGWVILLGSEGVINKTLIAIGFIDQPIRLMYTLTGVAIALVHVLIPFMVLSVWTSLQKLDPATEQAARSLGAGILTTLWRIVMPQALPGILAGGLIVFALAASAFATPAIIGGRRLKVVPTTIYDYFLGELNWPMGSAIAVALLVIVLLVSMLLNTSVERRYKQVFN